ncbi:hypothetical protein FH972_022929 [Carpinus fangiana]|uniref:Uncharacterized protein n=1 Tax=Carpinus fangiana TaxID=176857 RepID=A0A5N6KTZ6_9ROSI|nr:hypothetical protein FH972_022929 [Carpinus fangiana]
MATAFEDFWLGRPYRRSSQSPSPLAARAQAVMPYNGTFFGPPQQFESNLS